MGFAMIKEVRLSVRLYGIIPGFSHLDKLDRVDGYLMNRPRAALASSIASSSSTRYSLIPRRA